MSVIIDISHWNTITDWNKLKSNCSYIIMKATQGTSTVDSTLASNIKQCESLKIPYWCYAYLNKGSEKAQAEFLIKTVSPKAGSYFVGYVLDVEAGNTLSGVQEALDYLQGAVSKCMIYTMYSQYTTYKTAITGRGSNVAWWEARYGQDTGSYDSKYPCHTGADLHQYTSKGSLDGIKGDVDMSRISGTSKKESWFKTGSTTTTTTTTTTSTSTSTATGSYKAGDKVTLSNVDLYTSATSTKKANTISGTYYIWSATGSNGRIRITNSSANVGKSGAITGWINISAISGSSTSTKKASQAAKSYSKSYDKSFTTTTDLYMRDGASKSYDYLTVVPKGATVRCYGYYTEVSSVKWYYVAYNGYEGFCCGTYLK